MIDVYILVFIFIHYTLHTNYYIYIQAINMYMYTHVSIHMYVCTVVCDWTSEKGPSGPKIRTLIHITVHILAFCGEFVFCNF